MSKKVMVCVTQQKTCDRLIQHGHDLLAQEKGELFIIHVTQYDFKFLGNSKEGEALDYLYEKAFDYGAQLTVVRSNHVLETLVDLVKKHRITHLVLGESGETEGENNLVRKLGEQIKKQVQIIVIPS